MCRYKASFRLSCVLIGAPTTDHPAPAPTGVGPKCSKREVAPFPVPRQVLSRGRGGGACPGADSAPLLPASEGCHPQREGVLLSRGLCPPRLLRHPGRGESRPWPEAISDRVAIYTEFVVAWLLGFPVLISAMEFIFPRPLASLPSSGCELQQANSHPDEGCLWTRLSL